VDSQQIHDFHKAVIRRWREVLNGPTRRQTSAQMKNRVAIIGCDDNPDESKGGPLNLYQQVNKFTAVLKSREVKKGDSHHLYAHGRRLVVAAGCKNWSSPQCSFRGVQRRISSQPY
jgi:hypothetical protein